MGRREDCGEESQGGRQPGAPPSIARPLTSQDSILTESEKPGCWLACSICFCKDRAPPGCRKPGEGGRGRVKPPETGKGGEGGRPDRGVVTSPVWVGWKWPCTA